MRLWPRSTADRVHEAFAFLSAAHGYRLIADGPHGRGGSVTYRSDDLWIAVEWDRSEPWLEFAPTHSSIGRMDWEVVDHLLRGAEHWETGMSPQRTAAPEALAAWLRERLPAIEARFREPNLAETNVRLQAIEADRRRITEAWWRARDADAAT